MRQILSLTPFERPPLNQQLTRTSEPDYNNYGCEIGNQSTLFD
ncbi:MAG: hypothetical protein N838_34900 [Thiohalocapsa sp. PB-PSB1]|jgi:hypothetical protein|nr:MAG: hypothetical protein N838_34900 [Thiohalocapsa sp. PB-PSB1]